MVTRKTIKDDGHLTSINVNGVYGNYTVHIQLGSVTVIPTSKKTSIYINKFEEDIKGIVIGEH